MHSVKEIMYYCEQCHATQRVEVKADEPIEITFVRLLKDRPCTLCGGKTMFDRMIIDGIVYFP